MPPAYRRCLLLVMYAVGFAGVAADAADTARRQSLVRNASLRARHAAMQPLAASAGGDAMISFGGLTNSELALACTDQGALTDAYRAVIDRYDASVIDLDLEGGALTDTASIDRRAAAIATIQQEKRAKGETLDHLLPEAFAVESVTTAAKNKGIFKRNEYRVADGDQGVWITTTFRKRS